MPTWRCSVTCSGGSSRGIAGGEYLTEAEVDRLIEAARGNRHSRRDSTMILVAYRHGLRVSELVDLRWDQIDFAITESVTEFT